MSIKFEYVIRFSQHLICGGAYCVVFAAVVICYSCYMLVEHNLPPVANAGADKTVWLPVDTITLDGSNSTDDQHIASYQWTCHAYRFSVIFITRISSSVLVCWSCVAESVM